MKLREKSGLGVPAGSCRATLWDQRHAVTASLRDRRRDSSAIHSELFRFVSFRPSHSYAVRVIRRDVSLLRNSIFQEVKKKNDISDICRSGVILIYCSFAVSVAF